MTVEPLEDRKRELLRAIVRAHISTGAPVSSSAVARTSRRPISPATVRNEMAGLEVAGYLHQPHTSAGRVPTPKAYQFYARELAMRARLSQAHRRWINRALGVQAVDAEQLQTRIPHVLAELCHGLGLLLAPPLRRTALDQVRFVRLDDRRILAVLITAGGRVHDRVVPSRDPYRADELERMSVYLNQNFRGWTLEAIRAEMERRVAAERSRFLRQALTLCRQSFDAVDAGSNLRLEGMAHLVEKTEQADPDELGELLHTLEEKERLVQLLDDCLDATGSPLRIVIGLEQVSPAMKDFAFIGACYSQGQRLSGSLGLLGRTRMDYTRAVTAVAYMASLFDRVLSEN